MKTIVSFVFDVVGWTSASLDALFVFLAKGTPDSTAALVIASCLLLIMCCHDVLVAGKPFRIKGAARILGVALLVYAAALHLGTRVIPLNNARIKPGTGHDYRHGLSQDRAEELAASRWTMISAKHRLSPQQWLLSDSRMKRVEFVGRVEREGGGCYALRGKIIHFSTPDGADPRRAGAKFHLVIESGWLAVFRSAMSVLYVGAAVFLSMRRVLPWLRGAGVRLMRERALLAMLCGFVVLFAFHQWRFISQDSRMQMVTSRDDDGYMLERLESAAEMKTMNPWTLNNRAYGAIGFYPYALLPYAAGHLGIRPSVEVLNLHVRGIKLLISAGMLAAVWLLGARHFGRVPAMVAMLLLSTNVGFLSYSSYPFYPDVFMAMFSTLSLRFLLDLTARWNARSFFLAVAFAAASVSIKFLTFLLFPFIFVVGAVALWREHRGRPGDLARTAMKTGAITLALCVAVFFLCNPYLDYNIGWIVPNYQACGNYYSAETSQIVAGAAATWTAWMDFAYRCRRDVADVVLACVAAGTVVASCVGLVIAPGATRRSAPRPDSGVIYGAVLLLSFAVVFHMYLVRSVTLTSGIDQRLLLPLYPIVYLLAAWGVVRLLDAQTSPDRADVRPNWKRKTMFGILVVAGSLFLLPPRLVNAMDFFRHFGRKPEHSEVSTWLSTAEVPPNARIITSLQSYVPASYQSLINGLWRPKELIQLFYQTGTMPAAYIEDETYFDLFFSDAVKARGFNTAHQQQLFEEGSTFYRNLRHNRMAPFVLAHQGREVVATNLLGQITSQFRTYVNPYAFSENVATRAILTVSDSAGDHVLERLPASAPGGLSLRWDKPTTVSVIHLSFMRSSAQDLKLKLADGNGHTETLSLPVPDHGIGTSAQVFLHVDPPRDIRAMSLVSADGVPCGGDVIGSLRVHPPVPVGLNPTRHYFTIGEVGGGQTALDALIAFRPHSQTGIEIRPGQPRAFSLTPRIGSVAKSAWLVFDAAPPGACLAKCVYVFADQSRVEMDGVEQRSLAPDAVYFRWDSPSDKAVGHIEFSVASQAPDGRNVTLRQVHVKTDPATEEASQ